MERRVARKPGDPVLPFATWQMRHQMTPTANGRVQRLSPVDPAWPWPRRYRPPRRVPWTWFLYQLTGADQHSPRSSLSMQDLAIDRPRNRSSAMGEVGTGGQHLRIRLEAQGRARRLFLPMISRRRSWKLRHRPPAPALWTQSGGRCPPYGALLTGARGSLTRVPLASSAIRSRINFRFSSDSRRYSSKASRS